MSAGGKDVRIPNLKSEVPSFCLLQYGSNKIPYKSGTVSRPWDRELLRRPTELSGDVQDHFWSDGTIIAIKHQAETFLRLPC